MILDICDNSNILKVIRFAKIVIDIIKIAVPIILILSLSIEYLSAIRKDDQDLLAKANHNAMRKALAAILVFLIPTVVGITLRLSNPEHGTALSCIREATLSNIHAAATKEATDALEEARKSLERSDYNYAKQSIDNMMSSAEKTKLEQQLQLINSYISLKDAIATLKTKYDDKLYKEVQDKIKKIQDKEVQDKLYKALEEAGKGRPLDTQPGAHKFQSAKMTYFVNVPEGATTNMPLIMYLHGDGGGSNNGTNPFYNAAVKYFGKNYPFLIVAPNGGMWAETGGRLAELRSIIDSVCQQYSCDTTKIGISGHSRGSIGVWHMINNYPGFFHSAVPISCGSYSITPSHFVGTKIRAYAGTYGEDEWRYNREMRSNVDKIKKAGGDATFYSLQGKSHGTSIAAALTQGTLLWMIE